MTNDTTAKHRIIYWILAIIIAILAIFSGYLYTQKKSLETTVENNYNRAFHELVSYVDDIDTLLQKSMLVSSAAQMSTISSDLFRQTSAAKACLGQLPISEVQLEATEKFLSQIGDYTYSLSQNVINSKKVSEEDYKSLEKLGNYATSLNNNLLKMQEDIYNGDISFGTIKRNSKEYFENNAKAASGDMNSNFEEVEKEFQEYPSLIYDGPFSDHIENIKPAMLENSKEISVDEGLIIAKKFLGDKGQNLASSGESQNTSIDAYSYSSSLDNREIYITISKKGGSPVYFLDTREIEEEKCDFNEAISKAKEFLNSKGYTSLKESYYDKSNGIATINFAYTQGNVICYSDLIKVKVALDNCEIIGMEAHGYIMNHKHRNLENVEISEEQAKGYINPHLSVKSSSLALIPKDSKREVLCYEFKGNYNDRNFLVYINAKTGAEEQILMLIESENGILTI